MRYKPNPQITINDYDDDDDERDYGNYGNDDQPFSRPTNHSTRHDYKSSKNYRIVRL